MSADDNSASSSPASDNEDLKAKMREALEKKNSKRHGVKGAQAQEKIHGSEVASGGRKMFRRKAGG